MKLTLRAMAALLGYPSNELQSAATELREAFRKQAATLDSAPEWLDWLG